MQVLLQEASRGDLMTRIRLENLTKRFGKENAVSTLNLDIHDGEFLVLVGPSGCGKSTTLRMIAGLETPTSGSIIFDDRVVTHLPPRERNIGMVFQSYALYPHMTIRENLAFGLRLKGMDRRTIIEKVKETADILGLAEHLDKKPAQLSGGQRQRVALGRAIIRNPSCFLFDEPLSNLDAKLRVQMRAEIQRIQKRTGITSIYVTHDQVEAMSMANRIAIMSKGIIQQVGSPTEVYLRPDNKFVASFIGSPEMNIMEGTLIEKDGKVIVETSIGTREINDKLFDVKDRVGKKVYLGMRPEHLEISEAGTFTVRPDVIEPLGSDTFLYADTPNGLLAIRHKGLLTESYIDENPEIQLKIREGDLHLFDYETELSLRI